MTARVDQLALDLSGHATSAQAALKRAYLLALRGVLANAAAKLTAASLPTVGSALRQLVPKVGADDEDLQVCACVPVCGVGLSALWSPVWRCEPGIASEKSFVFLHQSVR